MTQGPSVSDEADDLNHPSYGDFDYDDCQECGGDGYTFDCVDGFCEDADVGCDICTRRCSACNPNPRQART